MSLLKEIFFEDGCLHGCFYGCFPCNSGVFSNINGLCNFHSNFSVGLPYFPIKI